MTCLKCGYAIPAQFTVLPTAKPKVKAPKEEPDAKEKEGKRNYVSFAMRATGKSSSMTWLVFGGLLFVFLFLVGGLYFALRSQAVPLPEIKESAKLPARMTELVISRQDPDYVVVFTLRDEKNVQIARSGQVKLAISEISHIGVAGSGTFSQESKLYEATFNVDASNFAWYTPGGFFVPPRMICAVRVPMSNLLRQPKPAREGRVTVKFYDGQDPSKMWGLQLKFFFSAAGQPAK